jgi:hypothetical protein
MSTSGKKSSLPAPSKGLYANYFEVGHTAFEVVVDFGQSYTGQPLVPCHTRIVMSPVYAHALLQTLKHALDEHESRFGRPGR